MKQKKYLLNKFHKKYVFLQNSLFDFLYWRSEQRFHIRKNDISNIGHMKNPQNLENLQSNSQKSLFFEQEQISLQEYWQSSDFQKIKNEIENINKDFRSSNISSNFFNMSKSSQKKMNVLNSSFQNSLCSLNSFQENHESIKNHKSKKYSFFFYKQRKDGKKTKFQTYVCSFAKKFNFAQKNSNFPHLHTLIPKSDCFRTMDISNFLNSAKLGKFLPKRKNFQQYWIFPLFGFVFYFSLNPLRHSNIQILSGTLEFQNWKNVDFLKQHQYKKSSNPFNSFCEFQISDFSYTDTVSFSKAFDLQKLQSTEFEDYSNFLRKNLNEGFLSYLIDGNNTNVAQNSVFQRNIETRFFSKMMDSKQNFLNWQWFPLKTTPFLTTKNTQNFFPIFHSSENFRNFQTNENKQHRLNVKKSIETKVPQKAQFFLNVQKNQGFFETKNDLTPIFHFSKSVSFLNQFEKNLFFDCFFKFHDLNTKNMKISPSFFQFNFDGTNLEIQTFLKNLKKEKKVNSSVFASFQKFFNSERNVESQMLQKWLQTQNLWSKRQIPQIKKNGLDKQQTVSPVSNKQKNFFASEQPKIIPLNFHFFENSHKNFSNFQTHKEMLQILSDFQYQLDIFYSEKMLKASRAPFSFLSNEFKNQEHPPKDEGRAKKNFGKKIYEFYVIKHWKSKLRKPFQFFFGNPQKILDQKNCLEFFSNSGSSRFPHESPDIFSNGNKASFEILNQLPIFLDFDEILNQLPIFLDFDMKQNFFASSTFQKENQRKMNQKVEVLRNFQTFLGNFRNVNSLLNNREFFANNVWSHPAYFGKKARKRDQFRNFVCSNFFEKTIQKFSIDGIFNISDLKCFQSTFFFEKMKKSQALTFQTSPDSSRVMDSNQSFWFCSNQKNPPYWFLNSKSLKHKFSEFQKISRKEMKSKILQFKCSAFLNKQNSKFGMNFHSKKFEKVFQKSFCDQKKIGNSLFSNGKIKNLQNQKKKLSTSKKMPEQISSSAKDLKNSFFKVQSEKESILFRSLANLFQNLYDSSKSSILLFSNDFWNTSSAQKMQPFSVSWKRPKNQKFRSVDSANKSSNFRSHKKNQKFQIDFLTPQMIFKRDGFFFFPLTQKTSGQNQNSQILKKIDDSNMQRTQKLFSNRINKQNLMFSSNFSEIYEHQNPLVKQRFEKEKYFQKKRRMKKQKLETRRRKKRKRFFPRPLWLRFHLYKKFLNVRHSNKNVSKKLVLDRKQENQNSQNFVSSFKKQKNSNGSFLSFVQVPSYFKTKKTSIDSFFMLPSKNFQNFRNIEKNSFLSKNYKKKIRSVCENIFERSKCLNTEKNCTDFMNQLYCKNIQKSGFSTQSTKNRCLKKFASFFLDSKAQIFSKRRSKNLVSKNIEDYKISGEIFSEFVRLSWKSYWFQMNFQPYIEQLTKNFRNIKEIEAKKSFDNLFQNVGNFVQKKEIAKNQPFHNISFCDIDSENSLFFRKSLLKKFLWYVNVQTSLNAKNLQNSNFQQVQNIEEYNRILYSRISKILKNGKSFENNEFLKNMKVPKRNNENLSISNANLSFLTKSALFFENFCIPSQPSIPAFSLFSSLFHDFSLKPTGELPTLRALWAFQKTNFSDFHEKNAIRHFWALKKRTASLKNFKGTKKIFSIFRKFSNIEKIGCPKTQKNESNQKTTLNSFFTCHKKTEFPELFHQLENMSYEKFQNAEKKASLFGMKSLHQNSKLSLRYLKFHLSGKFPGKSQLWSKEFFSEPFSVKTHFSNFKKPKKKATHFSNLKKPNSLNSAKSSLNYWWSQQNLNVFPSFFSSFNYSNSFIDFQWNFFDSGSFAGLNLHMFSEKSVANIQLICVGAIFFHLAILTTLLKIPEIRSILKFQGLIFSKFLNCFFLILFSMYDFVKKYNASHKIVQIFQSCFSFHMHFQKLSVQNVLGRSFQTVHTLRNGIQKNIFNTFSVHQYNSAFPPNFLFEFLTRFSSVPLAFVPGEDHNGKHGFFRDPVVLSENIRISGQWNNRLFSNSILNSQSYKTENMDRKFEFLFPAQKHNKFQNMYGLNQIFFFNKENFNVFLFCSTSLNFSKRLKQKFQKQYIFQYTIQQKNRENMKVNSFNRFFDISDKLCRTQNFETQKIFKKNSFHFSQKNWNTKSVLKQRMAIDQNVVTSFLVSNESVFSQKQIQSESFGGIRKEQIQSESFGGIRKVGVSSTSSKLISQLAFSFLIIGKSLTFMSLNFFKFGSHFSQFLFNGIEFFMFNIYKFLEKPAELMIEWIAFIFLIEWSSDAITFIPDTLDISIWKSSQKMVRPFRCTSVALSFLNLSKIHFFNLSSGNFLNSINMLTSSNVFSFVISKRLLYFFENFSYQLIEPDIDILVRQRKGMIFWDIWSEILLKAAEKYNVNIPSFVTLKEEQELFLEKFFQDSEFFQNFQIEDSPFVFSQKKDVNFEQNQHRKLIPQKNFTCSSDFFTKNSKPETLNSALQSQIFNGFGSFFGKLSNSKNKKIALIAPTLFWNFADSSKIRKNFECFRVLNNSDRWSCNQYGTYQSPETDLFVDLHPSKSMQHICSFKYSEPSQYTVGSLICQVYSGLFSKQVSKNILLIGSRGTLKTLFIQALAGETEMKIITDNAYRYSTVQRGVAVGMKYLRDVFDAIAFQTPCFFLMEHIHAIGSKRSLLISDEENIQGIQTSFGLEQQEVHEINQMIYQLSKHSISDSKRPYKGDFSRGIPTNFFVQCFSNIDAFSAQLSDNSPFCSGGTQKSPTYPLPIDSIENSEQNFSDNSETNSQHSSWQNRNTKLQSRLQISKEQIFAPPATSPFSVLMIKQQQKFKPKKIVQENSWISYDRLVSYQKESVSVRAKVAILADMTMNFTRGKLDMITDLLVILDSVRSNRGFVVFATTHIPSLLDPALRRPGRFDESILLPQNTNFLTRFEILKTQFSNLASTLDFFDWSLMTENFSEIDLGNLISTTKFSFFHQYTFQNSLDLPVKQTKRFSQITVQKAFQSFLKSSFFQDFYQKHPIFKEREMHTSPYEYDASNSENDSFFENSNFQIDNSRKTQISKNLNSNAAKHFFEEPLKLESKFSLRNSQLFKYTMIPSGPSHILSLAYSKIGKTLIQLNLLKDPTCFTSLTLDIPTPFETSQFLQNALYCSHEQQKLQFMVFLSGKISEFFAMNQYKGDVPNPLFSDRKFENFDDLFDRKFSAFPSGVSKVSGESENIQNNLSSEEEQNFFGNSTKNSKTNTVTLDKQKKKQPCSVKLFKNSYFVSAFANQDSLHSTQKFLFCLLQKRFLFTKNLLLSKMLFFENRDSRKKPPSPPNSSILIGSQKYENFKRTEHDFQTKARFSMNEKIHFHQQQRFFKQLYNIPVQQYFHSEIVSKRHTFFANAFQEVAYLDSFTNSSSSSNFSQRKFLGLRHRFTNINQWWTGFLPEHNTESTYLSDVDWRTMFISKNSHINFIQKQKNPKLNSSINNALEFPMDFPDAEHYYNPRNRRWFFNSFNTSVENSSYWFNFHTNLQYEIHYHFFMQSFHQCYQYFDQNREIIDFYVFSFLKTGFLKEFDFLTINSRFCSSLPPFPFSSGSKKTHPSFFPAL